MDGRHLVYNPPSLKLLSVCRIRQSISCMSKNVERNLVKKLRTRDYDYLRNPNMPISLEQMCLMERKLVLESCLRRGSWGILEMFILLTDDIVDFDVHPTRGMWDDLDNLGTVHEQLAPVIDIKLHYKQYADLLLSLLMVKCPKLESLTLRLLIPLPTALERFCNGMPHITKLNLSLWGQPERYDHKNSYDGVLRAIARNMPHLKYLDISCCTVKPKAIKHLLPTEDNALGGCPKLVELNLSCILTVDVKLLKKILLVLPKLRFLGHELLVYALVDLTEEEMDVDIARSLYCLSSWIDAKQFTNLPSGPYNILFQSPVFQRLKNNITTAGITINEREQNETALVADVLMSLTKLSSIQLWYISEANKHFLPVLESIGDRLQYLSLYDISDSLSVDDIMRTCPNLARLIMTHRQEDDTSPRNGINLLNNQIEKPSKEPVLNCLTLLCLRNIGKQMCSADMLIALLKSPNLNHIRLEYLEAMSDDVMFNVLSSPGCAALSKVSEFFVNSCPLITKAPFAHWLKREDCSLEHIEPIRFSNCEHVECEILGLLMRSAPEL